ncbi:hypothetical protein Taro_055061, partial [Colocasia esculenta]|nr:hypothetical protein [Colocasia esculenta]
RLPRLRESLAEPTHGAGLSRRSEVVFNSSPDLLPRNDLKKTAELSSFGQLKEEKLELHHHPQREAATST